MSQAEAELKSLNFPGAILHLMNRTEVAVTIPSLHPTGIKCAQRHICIYLQLGHSLIIHLFMYYSLVIYRLLFQLRFQTYYTVYVKAINGTSNKLYNRTRIVGI